MTKGIYSKQPFASSKAIADKNPMGTVSVGVPSPKMVPQQQPTIHGLNNPAHGFRTGAVKGSKAYGNIGKVRLSGHSGAHQVGKRSK